MTQEKWIFTLGWVRGMALEVSGKSGGGSELQEWYQRKVGELSWKWMGRLELRWVEILTGKSWRSSTGVDWEWCHWWWVGVSALGWVGTASGLVFTPPLNRYCRPWDPEVHLAIRHLQGRQSGLLAVLQGWWRPAFIIFHWNGFEAEALRFPQLLHQTRSTREDSSASTEDSAVPTKVSSSKNQMFSVLHKLKLLLAFSTASFSRQYVLLPTQL